MKPTTTKRVLWGTLVFCAISFVVVLVMWAAFDRTDATGIAGVIGGIAGVVIGFYEWKARAENMIKLKKRGYDPAFKEELDNELGGSSGDYSE